MASRETDAGDDVVLGDLARNRGTSRNRDMVALPCDMCVHRLFEAQARRRPNAPAVLMNEICLSYDEINRSANRIAHFLHRRGLKVGHLVALCLDRSPGLVTAALGVLKAGGTYVPLNPTDPTTRLSYMLVDAGVFAVLSQTRWIPRLPAVATATFFLDRDQALFQEESDENLDLDIRPEDLAYAIYTSGSTGQPKGVLIPHKGLSNLVAWHGTAYNVTESDRASLLATPAFDASTWEIWPYLAAGASLHIPATDIRDTPHELLRWFNSEGITLSFVPTPLAELLLRESWPAQTTLRALLTGGDVLHRGPDRHLPCRLFNHYGPTENTVVTTWAEVSSWKEEDPPPTIGRPIANVQIYILDSHFQPVPAGVAGELCLGGAGLARGYLNRPKLTAEKFVPHPFSDEPGARLYRTGDLVRFRFDGNLEFLGRLDHQVKIRGFRVELSEIETMLAACPDVREVAVVMREEAGREGRLMAYVVPQGTPGIWESRSGHETPTLISVLTDLLRSRLPEHMVPSAWLLLDELPRSPNGKINRTALPVTDGVESRSNFQAPETPVECKLANIWLELFGVSQVGLHDDFFQHMGGHSLLATRLISRIRDSFGVELPLRAVFRTPTVAGLAEAILQQQAASADTGVLEQLLMELEALPNDTASKLLTQEGAGDE
jgi:amino acid adenylation domain-containing protein